MMLKRLFSQKKYVRTPQGEGWLVPQTGAELLDTRYRQQVVKTLWDLTSLTRPVFTEYLQRPLERYAELVQLLPASENHHHAYAGGMLDHALEVVSYALRMRRQHLLPPGATPEEQSSTGELWTIAVAYAALLHDIAKILVDLDVHLQDGRLWRLWQGTIPSPYRVQYRKRRDYQLHQAANGLLCQKILGSGALEWLSTDSEVFGQFMYTITGYSSESGIIGEIVAHADRASVSTAMGGNPAMALKAPIESLQRKVVDALRYVVKEQLVLNVPRAPAYLTEDALWIVAPSVPNQVKSHLLQHGVGGVPSKTTRLYDEMQAHGLILEAGDGKSVWQCEVSIGDWQASLSFLKVPPSVIWGAGEERPSVLAGKLTVTGAEKKKEPATVDSNVAAIALASPVPSDGQSQEQVPTEHPSAQSIQTPDITNNELNVDDMISLIAGDECSKGKTANYEKHDKNMDQSRSECAPEQVGHDDSLDLGQRFVDWLYSGLESRKIVVNDTKAAVHVVEGKCFLVSPGIFRRFCLQEFSSDKQWEKVQRRFQKLGLHHRTAEKTNIFKVAVRGPNKKGSVLKGYLLKQESGISPHSRSNIYLSLIKDEEKQDA